ncbi:MAG: isocitrate lyase/phosphoenolpyruvate mutase family protein [Massilia sp.]
MPTQADKAQRFLQLHQAPGCFLVPNPWDAGSAKLLASLGFSALATSGAGIAFAQGKGDLDVSARAMLPSLRAICAATDLPVSADLQNGFGPSADEAAQTILEAAHTGIVGGSLEDASGDDNAPIYDIGLATDRIRAAAEAARSLPFKFMLTARCENFLYGRADLDDTIARLQAYEDAGADVLFAPGITEADDVKAVLGAIERPFNLLMGLPGMELDLHTATRLGVKRVSTGGSLARAAYGALLRAGSEIMSQCSFGYASHAISGKDMKALLQEI